MFVFCSHALMQALHELNLAVPLLRRSIRDGVIRILSSLLLPKNFAAGDQSSGSLIYDENLLLFGADLRTTCPDLEIVPWQEVIWIIICDCCCCFI